MGIQITITGTANTTTDERAEYLRKLYKEHVHPVKPGDHWKAACTAIVPSELAADVREAMDFHGSLVDDTKPLANGMTLLYSLGYWAHGF